MIDPNETYSRLHLEETEDLVIEAIDPDSFKRCYDEEPPSELETAKLIKPSPLILSPFDLPMAVKSQAVSSVSTVAVIGLIEILTENVSVLISSIEMQGIQETSLILHEPHSLLDQVEIIITTASFAPNALNIEIKSCDKLQALLQKNQGQLLEHLKNSGVVFKIHRLDLSLHNPLQAKDRIDGCSMKKVTQAGNTSDDNQT